MKCTRSVYRAAPEPRAWMPGQEQSWPRAQCSRALGLVPPASAQALPIVHPNPSPSLPTLTTALHAAPWCRAFTDFLTPHTVSGGHFLCVQPWCGRPSTLAFQAFPPAWRNPLVLVVGGGQEFFLSLAAEGKPRLRMQSHEKPLLSAGAVWGEGEWPDVAGEVGRNRSKVEGFLRPH